MYTLAIPYVLTAMLNLLGEYDCKLDAKGRMMFPAGLKKQLQDVVHEGFVVNRDLFDKCLVIYPRSEWRRVSDRVGRLNRFVAKNVLFIRRFNNGATPVELDAAGRLLLPPALTVYADLKKEVKVVGSFERIEVWSKSTFEEVMGEDIDLGALSEEVMGNANEEDDKT